MAPNRLRVYRDAEEQANVLSAKENCGQRSRVTVALGDVLSVLDDAVNSDRAWLRDFEDDEITISTDLYEIILAYQHYRRSSA